MLEGLATRVAETMLVFRVLDLLDAPLKCLGTANSSLPSEEGRIP